MMKLFSTAVFILTIASVAGYARARTQTSRDTLFWKDNYRLQLNDFRGAVERGSIYSAVSVCPLVCSYYTDSLTDTLCFQIYCFFDREASWIKSAEVTDELLAHEQLHFDIVEIYARILRIKLDAYKRKGTISEKGILNIINGVMDEKDRTQILYDKETDLSGDAAQQKKWNDKVRRQMSRKGISQFQ